jgi:O-antigen/teichoic acid export membrane protein
MPSIKTNIIFNYIGSGWTALMGVVFIPYYIKLMGAEAYGIVSVFVTLQAIFTILDLGLSQTLNREMARLSAGTENKRLMANTARTLEVIYWLIAIALVAVILLSSEFIALNWLNPEQLSSASLIQSLWVIGIVIGLRWPVALYMGGLNGLQRQISVNILLVIFSTLQGAGALAVLLFFEPTLRAFFSWQALIALFQVAAFRFVFLHCLDSSQAGTFQTEVLKGIWRFAAGISGISIMATVLTQLDKIILSKLLTLSEFGYYTFAATVAAILYKLISPVFTAYYPRLTERVSSNDISLVISDYHHGSQLMAVVVLPAALILAFFSREILELWTGDPDIVMNAYFLVSLLAIGNALNGLMHMPYALQLAHGWTRLALTTNVVAVIALAPTIIIATKQWGAAGAAGAWIFLNCGYMLINVQFMHNRLLRAEKWKWYMNDVGKPLLLVLVVAGTGRILINANLHDLLVLACLIVVAFLSTAAAISGSGLIRNALLKQFASER